MPEKIKNDITSEVMNKIKEGKIKMTPKYYFVLGSFISFVGLVASITTSVFLIALTRFAIRSSGFMAGYKFEQVLSAFPWWAPFLAIISFYSGIKLMRRYDFSYKKNFLLIVLWFVSAIFATGIIFDASGLNEVWLRRGPMRGIMKEYFRDGGHQINSGGGGVFLNKL